MKITIDQITKLQLHHFIMMRWCRKAEDAIKMQQWDELMKCFEGMAGQHLETSEFYREMGLKYAEEIENENKQKRD